MPLLEFIRGNLMECQKEIFKIRQQFCTTSVDHHVSSDINFNGHRLTKNNISIPKKVINLYISYMLGHQLRNLNRF